MDPHSQYRKRPSRQEKVKRTSRSFSRHPTCQLFLASTDSRPTHTQIHRFHAMADSLDAWIVRRLESYAHKHGLECSIGEPGKLVQVHRWLTFESPYWARVGDSESSILAVFSEESAIRYQTQTGRSITSLRRAVLRLTSIKPTLILPFRKAQTRDIAFDVLMFTVMNSGGEHEPIYYDRVKDTSRELDRGYLKDWVDGLKRKYNQVGLRPIHTSSNTNPVEPFPLTRPAPTHAQPSSSVGSPAPASLSAPPSATTLPSSGVTSSESRLPQKNKPRSILDLSWWIISPDQQVLLDAIDEPSRPQSSPSWTSIPSHSAQSSRATSSPSPAPEKVIPPTTTTDSPPVDQDSEEELSIRRPRAIGANSSTAKINLLQPAQQILPVPKTAPLAEPTVPSLSTPLPPKSAPPASASMDVDMNVTQDETNATQPKEPECGNSPVASQSQTITHSSPGSTRLSLPPLLQPQSQSRSSSQQQEIYSMPARPSSTAPPQHAVSSLSNNLDGISRTAEAQDGIKEPTGRASSIVLVLNSDADSLSRSQSLPLSWPPTEPPSSQPSLVRPIDRAQSLSSPRPSTQPLVSESQTQLLSQTQTQSLPRSTEKLVPHIIDLTPVQVPERIVQASEPGIGPTSATPAVVSASTPPVTKVNPEKRPAPNQFSSPHNESKKTKIIESTTEPGHDQNQNQIDEQAATATATTASSKIWSTVPMLRTGQPTYPDLPTNSQPTQAGGSETIEFSQMPDTQQRETARATLAQSKNSFPQPPMTTPTAPTAVAELSRPVVPLSVIYDRCNGRNKDGKQAPGERNPTEASAPARSVVGTSSTQSPLLGRPPAPALTPIFTSASTSASTRTPPSKPAPAPNPVPTSSPVPAPTLPSTRPARKVFKLQRTLPLAPGLPSEADILALLREVNKWSTLKQTDHVVHDKSV